MADTEKEIKVPYRYARMWPREVFYRQLGEPEFVFGSTCYECGQSWESGKMIRCENGHTVHSFHPKKKCIDDHKPWCKEHEEKKGRGTKWLYMTIDLLARPGVYVLYRDDEPYYVGQAGTLRSRLAAHARVPGSRYFNHWNYFSAFVVNKEDLNRIEAILIAAMPTANGRKPLKRERFPLEITNMVNEVHDAKANPISGPKPHQATELLEKEEIDEDES
ncbi:MAG: GIY-YIG nuclease family protein [Candidatus Korobacteraceae bacterium]